MGIKQKIIDFTKENSVPSRAIRYAIKIYGQGWRYFYCLGLKHKPLKQNRIVFMSHKGKQYSCNPQYICEYLMKQYPGRFEMIWAFKEPEQFQYLKQRGIHVVTYNSTEHIRAMMTAQVIVTNVDTFVYLPHRKGQMVLDTWHGGGSYKTCGFMNPQNLDKLRKRLRFERLYSRITLYVSSSRAFSEQTIRKSRHHKGEILEVGMPRNDMLICQDRPDLDRKVKDYFGLTAEQKIALYAPTFRSEKENDNFIKPDLMAVKHALEDRFGGDWCVLFRQHHFYDEDTKDVKSATNYPDMQELLYVSEVLITDYSSSIWDMSLMYKPVFLYCPDLQRYQDERSFYMPIEQWPFILCHDQAELEANIRDFDQEKYSEDVDEHHRILGSCESGHATEHICKRIVQLCGNSQDEIE